ncbi:MAG: VCBS repeat-containing protein [Gammaproteobacteria bacterium]|nr:VCBS repeat-containing protein [Gammaproteobacteria bacterium]
MHLRAVAAWTLLCCSAASAVELFEIHEIDTGAAPYQTVLPGSFTAPGYAELAVIEGAAGGEPRLAIHRLDAGAWPVVLETALDEGVLFVDVANVGGKDHPVLYRRGRVTLFDAATVLECCGSTVGTDYRASGDASAVPRVDVTRDLNGDGRDDLVMPDTGGFWIALQAPDGSFSDAVMLGPPEPHLDGHAYGEPRSYGEAGITAEHVPWYLGRVHGMDYDRDGRRDLVFWNGGGFEVHRQQAGGGFGAAPETFDVNVPFDFDGAYALGFQFGEVGVPSLLLGLGGRFEYTVLHGFRDLNADGVDDLVTLSIAGRRVFSARGRFDIHFGRPTPEGTAFDPAPGATLPTPGPAVGMGSGYATQRYLDMDGDGATDFGMASVDTGLGGMVRAMAGKSVTIDLALYRQRDGAFGPGPDVARRVRTGFAPFDRRGVLFPTVLIGDVNGDGRADLLAAERWDRLSVFLGVPGPELLAADAVDVAVRLPADERYAMLADLDRNGRQDVVIQYPPERAAHRVSVLMAR